MRRPVQRHKWKMRTGGVADHDKRLTLSSRGAYTVAAAVTLAGLLAPFAQQSFYCPPGAFCPLLLIIGRPSLFQGPTGAVLLALVSAELLAGLLSLGRPGKLISTGELLLSLATLALVSLDAATAGTRVFNLPYPITLAFDAGFYLATAGSAAASLLAIVLLVPVNLWPHRPQRLSVGAPPPEGLTLQG